MKIITWNCQNRDEKIVIKETIGSLFLNDADLVVLTGCRDVVKFKSFFSEVGLKNLASWMPASSQNGVLIASRKLLASKQTPPQEQIWLEADLPEQALTVLGIHISDTENIQEKETFWLRLIQYAEAQVDARVIMIGNFSMSADNLKTIFNFKQYFQKISSFGWNDAWRYLHPITYEQLWFSNARKGIQFDFVILSPLLQELLLNAYHSQLPVNTKYSQPALRALIVELG
jgi:exonuclease III